MNESLRLSSFPDPPEPVRVLSAHLIRAAREVSGPLPRWLDDWPLTAMSPNTRQLAWKVGRIITGNPDHGFAIAERVPPEAVGSLWELYRVAPNVGTLHEHYGDFSPLLLDDHDCVLTHGEQSVGVAMVPRSTSRVDRAEQDFRAAMQVITWRTLFHAPKLAPLRVSFTYARPKSTRPHEHWFPGATLRFSQPCFEMELARSWWEAPLPQSNRELFERRLSAAKGTVRALAAETQLEQRVDAIATQMLHHGPNAASVAQRLGLSVRTLHRRLAERGSGFRALLARARSREAELIAQTAELASAPRIPSRERAELLGFSGGGALRNARKRWSGRS